MHNEIWQRDEIQSPCVNICTIHPKARVCIGCMRTIDEIRDWPHMTNRERTEIVDELPSRTHLLKKRRGGRAARSKRRSRQSP